MSMDVTEDRLELAGDVVNGLRCCISGQHALPFAAQLICIGPQLGQVGGIRLEVWAGDALVADWSGSFLGARTARLGALTRGIPPPTAATQPVERDRGCRRRSETRLA